ncbi:MAG: MoxR family ATPase [Candidatus Bathyarchaeota archaeon]|nr:MoxR family ATPase [Candidatus Bathyarchaeota archaeon]
MDFKEMKKNCDKILESVDKVFVGEELLLRKLLCAGLSNSHVLFEDNPGLGKTLLTKTFAKSIGCNWGRIQFTPDLLPSDIIGTRVWRHENSAFALEKGPIFTNVLLADEINRSPPKTQSALLEAMEEQQVTIEGATHKLVPPFFVIATQNPIELEGTYPLPEAQIDRFAIKLSTGYVSTIEEECKILKRRIDWKKDDPTDEISPTIDQATFKEMQETCENNVYFDQKIIEYVLKIVRKTREHFQIEIGSSPRGGLSMLKVARAIAASYGRDFVTPDDVKLLAKDVLSHRIILKVEQTLEGVNPRDIIDEIVEGVEVPKDWTRGT